MKSFVSKIDSDPIKKGHIYLGEYSPTMYDPNTFKPYICLHIEFEGGVRKFELDEFYTIEDWRNLQLEKLGI